MRTTARCRLKVGVIRPEPGRLRADSIAAHIIIQRALALHRQDRATRGRICRSAEYRGLVALGTPSASRVRCPAVQPFEITVILPCMILLAAILYSAVGHAGASGYLAAMALMSVAPGVMKPSALILNILVASIATFQFYRAGGFSWKLLWPFAVTSVPCAFVGGAITLPGHWYKATVGFVLLFAAGRMLVTSWRRSSQPSHAPPLWAALIAGAIIGLLSGLTGTGGGIFLSPLLLFCHWAETRETSGVSAAFILVNSVAGILGAISRVKGLPAELAVWAVAAVLGGVTGSYLGSRRLSTPWLRRLLAMVLVVAGLKMIFA